MANLRSTFAGITSPNPFWLASAPPTDKAYNVNRAFEAGWGGVVWKTLGSEGPPVVNVNGPRYGAIWGADRRLLGLNNIELITDRPIEKNLAEIREVKRRFPGHAVIVSLMVESKREVWHDMVKRAEDTGADGLELNFGCPHGMSERGMGSAVGQVPDYTCRIVEWVKQVARTPVIVKLTPNITDISYPARAARKGGADAVSLINTINSITGVDLQRLVPRPIVGGASAHGGYCGPAVKPIALNMVAQVSQDPQVGLPVSGIGGISTWQDAAEFIALGATSVQVCTAVMHYGFRIIEDLCDGLSRYLQQQGLADVAALRGKALGAVQRWEQLDLNYRVIAAVEQAKCIGCGLCYAACNDGAHQAIGARRDERGRTGVWIIEDKCVGCNLCSLVCPVPECITMKQVDARPEKLTWSEYQRDTAAHPHVRSNRHDH